jgi:cation diffusion facilitator CzcD-associated flavoprotein CzcO
VSDGLDAIIIGSGFGGLCAAIKLREAGFNRLVVLEKADKLGGTWRDNTYPGCACDIPSLLYSLSFAPHAGWSRMYPTQPEIRAYLEDCVERFALAPHIRLGTRVESLVFDETSGLWIVQTSGEHLTPHVTTRFTARYVVSAVGGLSRPAMPTLPGLDTFAGPAFHSARWDHSVDLRGQHVVVIGTGASAIQFVPQIAPQVARLTLLQRTAPWVLPKADRALGERERWALRHVPLFATLWRWKIYWQQEMLALGFTRKVELLDRARRMGLRLLKRQVASDELRARLTPGYVPGCKRILISNDYYPALARTNVAVETAPIVEVLPHAVVTGGSEGEPRTEHRADVLIYATGFLASDPVGALNIVGRGGVTLANAWRDGMHAYLGITVPGFPNLFLLSGPNTGLGHNSVIFMFEAQIGYVLDCIRTMRRAGVRTLEVRTGAERDYDAALQRRLRRTVWATGCKSWYLDSHGRNVTLWPGFTVDYWRRLRRVDWRAYRRQFRPV